MAPAADGSVAAAAAVVGEGSAGRKTLYHERLIERRNTAPAEGPGSMPRADSTLDRSSSAGGGGAAAVARGESLSASRRKAPPKRSSSAMIVEMLGRPKALDAPIMAGQVNDLIGFSLCVVSSFFSVVRWLYSMRSVPVLVLFSSCFCFVIMRIVRLVLLGSFLHLGYSRAHCLSDPICTLCVTR